MRISKYLAVLEERFATLVSLEGDELVVVTDGRLPRTAEAALAGYRSQLIDFFKTGVDRELSIDRMSADLAKVGLVRLADTGAWTHPLGDEHADLIVAGILNPDALTREQRTELFAVFGARPERRVETVEVNRVHPGRYTWTESREPGVATIPMINGRRIR